MSPISRNIFNLTAASACAILVFVLTGCEDVKYGTTGGSGASLTAKNARAKNPTAPIDSAKKTNRSSAGSAPNIAKSNSPTSASSSFLNGRFSAYVIYCAEKDSELNFDDYAGIDFYYANQLIDASYMKPEGGAFYPKNKFSITFSGNTVTWEDPYLSYLRYGTSDQSCIMRFTANMAVSKDSITLSKVSLDASVLSEDGLVVNCTASQEDLAKDIQLYEGKQIKYYLFADLYSGEPVLDLDLYAYEFAACVTPNGAISGASLEFYADDFR